MKGNTMTSNPQIADMIAEVAEAFEMTMGNELRKVWMQKPRHERVEIARKVAREAVKEIINTANDDELLIMLSE